MTNYKNTIFSLSKIIAITLIMTFVFTSALNFNTTVYAGESVGLPDGIGGRIYINKPGSRITFTVKLPDEDEIVENGTAYIYSGFEGVNDKNQNVASDIGLQYSNTYKVWKPVMRVATSNGNKWLKNDATSFDKIGKENFTYTKGFKPGSTVNVTININSGNKTYAEFSGINNDNYTGKITCWLKNTNVSYTKKWKLLATVAIDTDNGQTVEKIESHFSTQFTNVKLDSNNVSLTKDIEDFATIDINSASISVNHNEEK